MSGHLPPAAPIISNILLPIHQFKFKIYQVRPPTKRPENGGANRLMERGKASHGLRHA
jgi:hypothetical protein